MRRRPRSLASQVLLLQLVVVAVVLVAVAGVSIHQSSSEFRAGQSARMIAVAENLASTPVVRAQSNAPEADRVLAPEVGRAVDLSGAGIADVVGASGVIVASSIPDRTGRPAELGDSLAPEGRAWSGDAVVDGRRSISGHVPVLSPSGEVRGVVAVSTAYPSTWELLVAAGPPLLLYLGIGACLGLVGSILLSRRVKTHTRGLEIEEIAHLADHREALLHSIGEGVIAVNPDGVVTVLNDSGAELLGIDDAIGRTVDDLALEPTIRDYLKNPDGSGDSVLTTASRVLVLSRRAASSKGRRIGTITTMRDSTELARMQSQLSSHRSVTDTLRAQTHEFANQLHTISGLNQLGDHAAVTDFVGALTRRRAEINASVTQAISDPAVAALLIAKTSLAAEAGVALELEEGSHLAALDPILATDVITVLGNLVDNAVDASAGTDDARIVVSIDDSEDIEIQVADSGPGVPAEMRTEVFSRGVTTKPDAPGGRGIGLALVRIVSSQYGGSARVADSDSTGGALFTVRIPTSSLPPDRVDRRD
ncbi:Spo0B domain-containing protein [Rhodococcus sp. BP-252]|uniref:histidine kinase n=1 Tax=Rhodococcoides kyotonense TaxID=398843 RepID=A0A177YEA9_9NOCA|nr:MULTISPECIES: ATP-binding protein [Rhodococcus]MBY6413001.1 Spo0B domain-containing protein [Rhodococcus sp. BP-320]MBY6418560.1 Spo0B domain-containing protein [Rhodococcus sp. BP-321]MBY6422738.1 Spo0B domain-containing protein [Rhodococcus sp. BP-324]MBY6428474.1 Spo0B domain-containing protein [Rhodococcus sp. BP-323]MBY6432923.1 Spo0B domain-containing protein [Rhodococcus sp. BP-322]